MKKLMIAAAIVCAAAFSHGASVTWSASNIYQPGSTDTKIASGSGLVYLFCSQDYAAASVSSILSDENTTLESKVAALNGNSINSHALSADGKVSYSDTWSKTAGTYNYFMVIFAADSVAVGGKYVVSALSADTAWDNTGNATVGFGTQKTLTQNASNWATVAGSVPEPTSGLLLLVGGALLGLRRRRA